MKVIEFLNRIKDIGLPLSDGYDLISWALNIEYTQAKSINIIDDNVVENILNILSKNIPTAYITNRREFYGREFFVDNNVLIPRVESEIIVNQALEYLKNINNGKVLDLCTGSGCLLISVVAECMGATGLGIDISKEAINVAEINSKKFKTNNLIKFECGNILNYDWKKDYFDVILCNPPYLSNDEYEKCDDKVKYEPKIALVAEDDGLLFYKNILSKISILCKKGSILLFELGYKQKNDIEKIVTKLNLNYEFIKDYFGINRVLKIVV